MFALAAAIRALAVQVSVRLVGDTARRQATFQKRMMIKQMPQGMPQGMPHPPAHAAGRADPPPSPPSSSSGVSRWTWRPRPDAPSARPPLPPAAALPVPTAREVPPARAEGRLA
jgi:hypothetical protein